MALKNVSNKEKTVKSMYSLLPNDNYTVDKMILYCKYPDGTIIELGNILDNYRDYFEQFLVDADVPESMFYQPAAFAEFFYGTPDLDFLVLYFAKMLSLFDFKKSKIKVLPKAKLLDVSRLFLNYKKTVEESYKNPTGIIIEEI